MGDAQRLADIKKRYDYWQGQLRYLNTVERQMQLDIGFLIEQLKPPETDQSKNFPYQTGGDR